MTQLQGRFTRKHLVVVIHYLKSLPKPSKMESIEPVSFSFPDSFRIADLLPTAVLPVSLSLLTPTRLFNCRQLLLFWQARRDSNSRHWFWRPRSQPLNDSPILCSYTSHVNNFMVCDPHHKSTNFLGIKSADAFLPRPRTRPIQVKATCRCYPYIPSQRITALHI